MQPKTETAEQGVARRIKERREALGLSQVELASWLKQRAGFNLDPTGVTRIERGERSIRVDELVAFATALGVTVADLLVTDDQQLLKDELVRLVTTWEEVDRRRAELVGEITALLARTRAAGSSSRWTGKHARALQQAHQIEKTT